MSFAIDPKAANAAAKTARNETAENLAAKVAPFVASCHNGRASWYDVVRHLGGDPNNYQSPATLTAEGAIILAIERALVWEPILGTLSMPSGWKPNQPDPEPEPNLEM